PAGISHLVALDKLNGFNLEDAPITDEDLQVVAKMKSWRWIMSHSTKLDGTGFRFLTDLPLEHISVDWAQISEAGAAEIAKIKSLKYVSIRVDEHFSTNGVRELLSLPALEKIYVEGGNLTPKERDVLLQLPLDKVKGFFQKDDGNE